MNVDIGALKTKNAQRWASAKITGHWFGAIANALIVPSAKARYKAVEARTGVPWYVIAVIHEREASQNWNTQLAQGDPLHQVSTHIPKGTGPFDTWEDGAYDALVNQLPYAANNRDWSPAGVLTLLEEYNGLGYAKMGRPSPYVWAGTDQYVSGKYVKDGVYDPNFIDNQPGCAGLLMAMMRLDQSIILGEVVQLPQPTGNTVAPPATPMPAPPVPQVRQPQLPIPQVEVKPKPSDNIFVAIFNAIIAFFKGSK